MAITNTLLGTTAANIFASSGNTVVSVAYFCNTDSVARTFNLYAVPSGGLASATTQVYRNIQIAAGDTFVVDMEKIVLADGDMLQANCSQANVVSATISYVGI